MFERIGSLFDAFKILSDVRDNAKAAELRLQIADIMNVEADARRELATAKQEMIRLQEENEKLRQKNVLRSKLKRNERMGFYELFEECSGYAPGKYCPICREADGELAPVVQVTRGTPGARQFGAVRNCHLCNRCVALRPTVIARRRGLANRG